MADMKTSEFTVADTLDGTEIIGIVQSGADKKTTVALVSTYVEAGLVLRPYAALSFFAIGQGAISYYSGGIAIGYNAYGGGGIAIGKNATAPGQFTLAIGNDALALDDGASVAIGASAIAISRGVAIGGRANAPPYAVAMGHYAATGTNGVVIGSFAYGYDNSIVIGYRANGTYSNTVAIGHNTNSSQYSITIGKSATTVNGDYGVTRAIAIGYNSTAQHNHAIAIGDGSSATNNSAIAIGNGAVAGGLHSMAFGVSSSPHPWSISFGSFGAQTAGAFNVSGHPSYFDDDIIPTTTNVKLAGVTGPTDAATIEISDSSFTITVTYAIPGTIGNAATFAIDASTGPTNRTLNFSVTDTTFILILATDGSGALDASQNILSNFASLFVGTNFNYSYTAGHDSDVLDIGLDATNLMGGDGVYSNPFILTADQNPPITSNTPALRNMVISNVTCTVLGWQISLLRGISGPNDSASFKMAPVTIYRTTDGNYHILGTPTFTLLNSTIGGASWTVPVLNIINNGADSIIAIKVADQSTSWITWVAFLNFESNK